VGAQTFNPRLLKIAGRKHTSEDTVQLLTLLKQYKVNYSFDLLFGLPTQTLAELRADVLAALQFEPSQLSAYLLTVPESHPMAKNRAPDEEQVEMFNLIDRELEKAGVLRYEISNFAKPGLESRHNMLYWTDQAYWGLGVSAHSYFPRSAFQKPRHWGLRFWNSSSIFGYEKELRDANGAPWEFARDLPEKQCEQLTENQSLSEFCHTSLRLSRGLSIYALRLKFGESRAQLVRKTLIQLEADGYLSKQTASKQTAFKQTGTQNDEAFFLTAHGRILANHVFAELTYLPDSLPK
jgi:oxygen-independent coproporphyrinogen-3 oxidase